MDGATSPIAGNWLVGEPPASGRRWARSIPGSGATVHNHLAGSERTSCGDFLTTHAFSTASSFVIILDAALSSNYTKGSAG